MPNQLGHLVLVGLPSFVQESRSLVHRNLTLTWSYLVVSRDWCVLLAEAAEGTIFGLVWCGRCQPVSMSGRLQEPKV